MHAVLAHAKGFFHRLTGAPKIRLERYTYPPRYLWGDIGLPQDTPHGRPRGVPAHLLRS